ncbi:MAG: acyl-CoA mutase large subunit family protein [Taibaiella sp.]|nr:acyl-CoA mutase large subunit family protein [Taibaiella sp.]
MVPISSKPIPKNICEESWKIFQKIEDMGGWNEALDNRYLQQEIREQAADLVRAYTDQARLLIGVNQYTLPGDDIPGTRPSSSNFGIPYLNIEHALKG